MAKLPVIATIEGLGKIVESCDDFYTELQDLKASGASLISPRDEAYARLQTQGKEDIGREHGTRTSMGFAYIKGELPLLTRNSRLLNLRWAEQAVKANQDEKYFCTPSQKEYKASLNLAKADENKEPSEMRVIVLPSRDNFTSSLNENRYVTQFSLQDQTKDYLDLNGSIKVYPLDENTVDSQKGTILTQLWFGDLGDGSGFFGGSRGLHGDYGARGQCH